MKHKGNFSTRTLSTICSFLLTITLISQGFLPVLGQKTNSVKNSRVKTEQSKETVETAPLESSILPTVDFGVFNVGQTENIVPQVGSDLGFESEPNGTAATADALTGTEGKIKALLWREPAATSGVDTDFYAFTTSAPNTRIYAATMTAFSGASNTGSDTTLDLIASDGTTVIETDLNDGTFTTTSSSIAGANLAAPGTYYLRVTNVSTTAPVSPYDLYFALRDAAPTPEVEPNNAGGTPNPMPASGVVSGTITAADNDTYSIALNAGDTVYLSVNADPERDAIQWNARLGLGSFGTPGNFLVINDASTGSAANPLSEAMFMTVRTAGTYIIYVDEPAGGGAATATYTLNATVIPAPALSCTTYTNNTATPLADAALTSSSITVPGSPIIKKLRVYLNITHPLTTDLDVHLVSPAGNDNGLFTDIATVAAQTAPQMNFGLDDDAAVPIGNFGVNSGAMIWQPEVNYRLGWFSGENAGGNWRLDIRDDTSTNTGTLNSWSLEVCTDPTPLGNLIYNEDFEAGNGGFTHSGTQDEWEYGTPNTTNNAPITTCASGTNCWKTDLDNSYNASSSQDLTSPVLNLTQYSGTINLNWQQRYQIESIAFDRMWVQVTEVGNPTNTRIVWQDNSPTMTNSAGTPATTINESAGWGRYSANISDFAGKVVQVTFHLDSDTSVNLSGWAVDDVQLYNISPTAANVGVAGRVIDAKGNAISRAIVTLTGSNGIVRSVKTNTFGYYRFETVEVGETYILNAERKGYLFSPRVVSVQDEISDADIEAIE